jgi:hypothetical protein
MKFEPMLLRLTALCRLGRRQQQLSTDNICHSWSRRGELVPDRLSYLKHRGEKQHGRFAN